MSDKPTREMIVEQADRLFYQQGFSHTSFAHIAEAVNISRGNFYHHFRTKDDILDAVIDLRLARTRRLLRKWEQAENEPSRRIRCFIDILIRNKAKIAIYGCPLGTLCTELGKLDHASQGHANQVFSLFRAWLGEQFGLLGYRGEDADRLAMHLVARSQGVAALASAFRDTRFIATEVRQLYARLDEWCRNPGGAGSV